MRMQLPDDFAMSLVAAMAAVGDSLAVLGMIGLLVASIAACVLTSLRDWLFDTSCLDEHHEQETTPAQSGYGG